MTLRSDGRRVVSVTMQPELYEQLYATCKRLDLPVTVWCREAIRLQLLNEGNQDETSI
jgi:predicted DNA-binding protein